VSDRPNIVQAFTLLERSSIAPRFALRNSTAADSANTTACFSEEPNRIAAEISDTISVRGRGIGSAAFKGYDRYGLI
jgi:hypothetical protein